MAFVHGPSAPGPTKSDTTVRSKSDRVLTDPNSKVWSLFVLLYYFLVFRRLCDRSSTLVSCFPLPVLVSQSEKTPDIDTKRDYGTGCLQSYDTGRTKQWSHGRIPVDFVRHRPQRCRVPDLILGTQPKGPGCLWRGKASTQVFRIGRTIHLSR